MHALIINGSPRVKKYSNTDKILEKITSGMKASGATFEQYEVSDRAQWEMAYGKLARAWDASGHQDRDIEAAMLRAKRHAYPPAQEETRRKQPPQRSSREMDWEKVVSDVLIGIIKDQVGKQTIYR